MHKLEFVDFKTRNNRAHNQQERNRDFFYCVLPGVLVPDLKQNVTLGKLQLQISLIVMINELNASISTFI